MKLILYQPEIGTNVGASIRIASCFDAELHIIEPCGFPLKSREINRIAMDYRNLTTPITHTSWQVFCDSAVRRTGRLVLLTTKASSSIHDFQFEPTDQLLFGQESCGVPAEVRDACDHKLRIPIASQARSLNLSVAAAVALAEARRQLGFSSSA